MNSAPTSRLAAIVFDRDEDVDAMVSELVASLRARGMRVGGLLQAPGATGRDLQVRDIETGQSLPIMQDLGKEATGCAVDPAAIAVAARMLDAAREKNPDLLIVNRFGRLESEGGGMIAEIGAAVANGEAVLICVPARYCEAWNHFACDIDTQLPPRREPVERWARAIAPAHASGV